MSDDNILNGFEREGSKHSPVGLSRNSMQKARALLVEKKLLVATQVAGGGGRGKAAVWSYSLNLSDNEKNTPETSQTLTLNLSSHEKNNPPNLSNFDNVIRKDKRTAEEPETPLWVPREPWLEFAHHRKEMRAPLTDRSRKMLLKELDKLRAAGDDLSEVLNQSIRNHWRGIFPLRKVNSNGKKPTGAIHNSRELDYTQGADFVDRG